MEQTELLSPLTDRYSRTLVHDHALFTAIIGDKSPRADHGGHTVYGVELRPLVCWNCGLESRREHKCLCLSLVHVVCCQVEVSAMGRSLFQRSSTEYVCVWVWSSNHKEEILAHYDWWTMKRRTGGNPTRSNVLKLIKFSSYQLQKKKYNKV